MLISVVREEDNDEAEKTRN